MSKISLDDVVHIAHLAKLKLSSAELAKFQSQLSEIISYISKLDEVDTAKIEPTSQTTGLTNVTRSDKVEIKDCLNQKEALSGSNKKHNGYFVVPLVLDKDSNE
jgi:aspartyl-tRNA(Asn)/glutamyl-tRNA(Gln) amidotransferase subunit C